MNAGWSSTTIRRHRVAVTISTSAVVLLLALVAGLFVVKDHDAARNDAVSPVLVGHVHGIAVVEDQVLIGAHYGVFSVASDGKVAPYGDRRSDTMALAAVDDRLLASGHPNLDERDAPLNAGLLQSEDGAQTWQTIALAGEADFHALDGSAARTWGLDSVTGRLVTSVDDRNWTPVAAQPFLDIAVDPTDDNRVLATTDEGVVVRVSLQGDIEPVASAPLAGLIATQPNGDLWALGPDGQFWRSTDTGGSWQQRGAVLGQPEALTVTADAVYAATTTGIYKSDETGQSFDRLFGIK